MDVLQEKHMQVPLIENPTCAVLKEYEGFPKTEPFRFMEDDVTWVALKISDAAWALGVEAIELRNWLIRFG